MTLTTKTRKTIGPDGEWVYETVYLADRRPVPKAEYDRLLAELTPPGAGDAPVIPNRLRKRGYPFESMAAGVHRTQVETMKKLNKARGGPPTEFTRAGNPVFTSHYHRKAYLKANRLIDRNSYC